MTDLELIAEQAKEIYNLKKQIEDTKYAKDQYSKWWLELKDEIDKIKDGKTIDADNG